MTAFAAVSPRLLFLLALLGGLATFLQGCGYYSKRVECHDGCALDISCDGKELVRKPNSGCKRDKEFKSEPTEDTCSDVLEKSHEDLTKLCWPLFSDSHSPPYKPFRQGNITEPPGNPNVTITEPRPKTLAEVETDQGDEDEVSGSATAEPGHGVPDSTTAEPGPETKAGTEGKGEDGDEVSDSTTAEPGSETKVNGDEASDSTTAELGPESKAETERKVHHTVIDTKLLGEQRRIEKIERDLNGDKTEPKAETKPEPETPGLIPTTNMEAEGKPDEGLIQMSESASVKKSLRTGSVDGRHSSHIDQDKSRLGRKNHRFDTPNIAVSVMAGAEQHAEQTNEPATDQDDSSDVWDMPKRASQPYRSLHSTLAAFRPLVA